MTILVELTRIAIVLLFAACIGAASFAVTGILASAAFAGGESLVIFAAILAGALGVCIWLGAMAAIISLHDRADHLLLLLRKREAEEDLSNAPSRSRRKYGLLALLVTAGVIGVGAALFGTDYSPPESNFGAAQ